MNHTSQKIVLAGGSGFLGQALVRWFAGQGWQTVVLSRRPNQVAAPAKAALWDGATLGDWRRELDGAAAVINLAGRSVNCRYHAANRREILLSRINPTRALGDAICRCTRPPEVWLNSSTATIYKHSFARPMDEATGVIAGTPEVNDVFSVDVAQAWERAFDEAPVPQTRKIALRTSMVLGTAQGTVFRVLRRLARLGLGGAMAGGRQYVSWIHETDFCRAVEWLIARDDISGPVNVSAPHPMTNRDVMRLVREVCGVRLGLPAARWMLEIGAVFLRTETELILKSRRVVPARLLDGGFEFRFPEMRLALADLEERLSNQSPDAGVAKNPFSPIAPCPKTPAQRKTGEVRVARP
jgi:uncharacterized protein